MADRAPPGGGIPSKHMQFQRNVLQRLEVDTGITTGWRYCPQGTAYRDTFLPLWFPHSFYGNGSQTSAFPHTHTHNKKKRSAKRRIINIYRQEIVHALGV